MKISGEKLGELYDAALLASRKIHEYEIDGIPVAAEVNRFIEDFIEFFEESKP